MDTLHASQPGAGSVLLETNRPDAKNKRTLLFTDPVALVTCSRICEVAACLKEIDRYVAQGYHAAGYLSYEAGYALESSLPSKKTARAAVPLLWFGIYKKPRSFSPGEPPFTPSSINGLRSTVTRKGYTGAIKAIKNSIRRGDTYQVNYTFKFKFKLNGSPYGLYRTLRRQQKVAYSAFLHTGPFAVLSFSPELFFRRKGPLIETMPMKGTWRRGATSTEDLAHRQQLRACGKNRSENIMIVDLLRNDLAKIALPLSVKTTKLFAVETYETLHQMVSTVQARLPRGTSFSDIAGALFPCGSVTGAPKVSTMKIIGRLETEPRHVYTGCIGYISPKEEAVFNVAIRTLLIDTKTSKGELGVGSGVVYDSSAPQEFEECRLKGEFFLRAAKPHSLIESLRWDPQAGYALRDLHIERLLASAKVFRYPCDRAALLRKLAHFVEHLHTSSPRKVRLLLSHDGAVTLEASRIAPRGRGTPAACFSQKPTDSKDLFLFHKTTRRELYDTEYRQGHSRGYFDVLFTNEKGEVTEGAISNIVIQKGRRFYTPPVSCGLLPGVYRKHLLTSKEIPLSEKVLYKRDVFSADRVFLINSVRGMTEVRVLR